VASCCHIRTFIAGTAITGLSVASSSVVARSSAMNVRHLGQHVRRRRADDHQIGLPRKLDVPHLHLVPEIPERGVDGIFAERGERHGGDELRPAIGEHACDLAARLADQADKLARFVGGNAAAHHQQDTRGSHRPAFASTMVTTQLL
jgi:hypothetical protein